MKAISVTKLSREKDDVEDVYFDLAIVIQKDGTVITVDNSRYDYKEMIDCNTLTVKPSVIVSV